MPSRTSILYWKEIPVQVKSEDADNTVSLPLDHRFQEAADAVAMMDGSYGSDAYLDAWQWGDATESDLDAHTAAQNLAERINDGMPGDFVARIRDLHDIGDRIEEPGAIDHWITLSILPPLRDARGTRASEADTQGAPMPDQP